MLGIVEIISLLLGMSGFGLQSNPKAPTPDASLEYAMPDADVVAYFDAAAVIPGNYKTLTQLADQPQIKASQDLSRLVRQAVTEVESARGLAKTTTGIDVTSDISDAAAFLQVVPGQQPNAIVALHGKFSTAIIDKLAKLFGKGSIRAGAAAWVDTGDGNAIAVTKTGTLLAGTNALVRARLDDGWHAPPHGAGTNLGQVADVLAGKPVFAVVVTLSQTARTEALSGISGQNVASDLLKRQKLSALAMYRDGIGWTWIDSTAAGLDSMAEMSDGVIDLLRASQVAPRGFAKIVIGALDSYRGTDKQVDDLIRHKADLAKIIDTYTGDGKFKAQVDKDVKAFKLTVRLTGKSLSEVVPLGGLVPLAVIGFVMRSSSSVQSVPIAVPPMPPTPAPAPAPTKRRP